MVISLVGYKGGVGKTTSAVHIAAYMQQFAPTLLVDGDPNRSCLHWARNALLPFTVIDEKQLAKHARNFEHIVVDSEARPTFDELKEIAEGSDLLIVPTDAEELAVHGLTQALADLQRLGNNRWKILQTKVQPYPNKDAEDLRKMLIDMQLPHFQQWIRIRQVFRKATNQGVLVQAVKDPKAREAWAEYEAVGKEIMV
jgi:chromosome partitioning protein